MQKEYFKITAFVSLILRKDKEVLLIRRQNTGYCDGHYACAGGKIDGNKTMTQAIIREANEKLGISLKEENIKVVHTVHKTGHFGENVNFFFEATEWNGQQKVAEPNKCDDIKCFTLSELPENIMPVSKHVIEQVDKKNFYSEFGWK
jgi:8-oxo-dGTP diphosphatase